MKRNAINWAAVLIALATSITSLQLKLTADGLELQLQRAQAQLDGEFSLAVCE